MPIYKMKGSKNGKQKYRVRINYTDASGQQHQIDRVVYGSTEAKTLESQLQKEYRSGSQVSIDTRLTVKSLYDEYMIAKKNDVRITSYDKTRRNLERYVIPYLGDTRLDRLSAPVLQKWKQTIANQGISSSTQRNQYGELRALLNYAVKMEYITRNPLITVGNFKDKDFTPPKDKINYYTPEEFLRYITEARKIAEQNNTLIDWGYYVFFSIAYYTGMRKGEINALKWSDIDGNMINVRRSVSQKIKGVKFIETPPKNKTSYRTIQMPTPLKEILDEHHNRYQSATNVKYSDDLRVCGGNGCLGDTALDNKNREFAKKAGLLHIRIHDFRHSHASLLANEGINIQEIARRLGHSKIEQTWNTYAHLYPREEERAIKILDNITQKTCKKRV